MTPGVATLRPPVDPARDHLRGSAEAPVTLVEYGDFQCPYCGEAYPVVKRLEDHFGERLRFVFRHMPVTDLHPRAQAAAEAAEAAAAQGPERFDRELREGVHAERVREDFESGARSGVPSTPRFFVDDVIHLGSPSEPELRRAIEAR